MKKKALVLGSTGQDGSYMVELLLKKNYQVHGLIRKSATGNTKNLNHLINNNKIINKKLFLHRGDLLDIGSISNLINSINPSEVYNFADQDHVSWSFNIPSYSFQVTALAVIEILELLKTKKIKYFQPISSNIFGVTKEKKQNEMTRVNPNSIYALGKVTALNACEMYNRIFNMHNCGAIFYNHESPRRGKDYVTQKIVNGVCEIYNSKKKILYLGDLSAKIDWGYAKDYVDASWKIMQLKKPEFFIIASGKTHSVEHFVKKCFEYVDLDYKKFIKIDKKLLRLAKTSSLIGNNQKAKKIFNYKCKTNLNELIKIMMDSELKKYIK
jgi:GDPmannose 4,6-dehydratase